VTEFVQVLPDGNRIVRKSSAPLYRDSQGRVRREQSFNAIGPFAAEQHTQRTIFISDPVANVSYILDPQTIMARKMTLPTRAGAASEEAANPPLQKKRTEAALQSAAIKKVQPVYPPIAKAAGAQGVVQVRITVNETGDVINAEIISGPPLLREAALEAAQQWKFNPTEINGKPVKVSGVLTFNFTLSNSGAAPARAPQPPQPPNAKTEPLGTQVIEGVQAEGKRITITIPAGQIGNERPIEIVRESWFSPELQITVMTRQYDPRQGETIYRLTNLNRAEPDASLFQVPSDYTIKEEPFGFRSSVSVTSTTTPKERN
jgi:TonB family protein